MGHSVAEGKPWTRERILARNPSTVLDCGAGSGTYSKLLDGAVPHLIAVEVWEPSITRFRLHDQYEQVICGDIRDIDFPDVDAVILGDVLEHLPHDDALRVWAKARAAAEWVYLSLPIYGYEQGPIDGNGYETHLHQWSHGQVLDELDGIEQWWLGQVVGCYEAWGLR